MQDYEELNAFPEYPDEQKVVEKILAAVSTKNTSLYLSMCNLRSLPHQTLLAKDFLTRLGISFNHFTTIPDDLCQFSKLVTLYAGYNSLKVFPCKLSCLTGLRNLHLRNNNLTQLPKSIRHMTQLEVLDLSHNQIKRLPGEIRHLSGLQNLCLKDNKLTTLPDAISHLTRLTSLSLRDNNLVRLCTGITALENLSSGVSFAGNEELEYPPYAVVCPIGLHDNGRTLGTIKKANVHMLQEYFAQYPSWMSAVLKPQCRKHWPLLKLVLLLQREPEHHRGKTPGAELLSRDQEKMKGGKRRNKEVNETKGKAAQQGARTPLPKELAFRIGIYMLSEVYFTEKQEYEENNKRPSEMPPRTFFISVSHTYDEGVKKRRLWFT